MVLVIIPVWAVVVCGQSRRPGSTRPPTIVRDETGREADKLRKDQYKNASEDAVAASATKLAIEDFMEIQKLGRSIHELSNEERLDLEGIATAAKEINKRSSRLRTSLSLPSPPKEAVDKTGGQVASSDDLSTLAGELNANIRAFVTNPRFRNLRSATDPEAEATQASVRLARVIEISRGLHRRAEQLRRTAKP
jgi:hypothetical protein